MRVGSYSILDSYVNNQQKFMSDLVDTNNQISSGKKIQYGFQNTNVFLDTLKLDYEETSIGQIKDTSNKAKTYSDNTDVALKQLKDSMESFKVKLIQASNGTHSTTSLNAIAQDLESLKDHMLNTANSSINGTFLFAGTNVKTKPFDSEANYYGNNEKLYAKLGDRLNVAYNINGTDLFFGKDIDYKKHITTNVKKTNQIMAHHAVLSEDDPVGLDFEEFITVGSSIKELIGQPNDNTNTTFYLRGKMPAGEGFKTKFNMNNNGTVTDLLDKIGRSMGNTEIFKAVDVTLSEHGQIEVQDVRSGQLLTDFHIVAADKDVNDLKSLANTKNAHIFEFQKSGFAYTRTQTTISSTQDFFDQRAFSVNAILRDTETEAEAKPKDSARDIMGSDVDQITINVNGKDYTHSITALSTIDDILTNLKQDLETQTGSNIDVSLEHGKILILDNSATGPGIDDVISTKIDSFTITAKDSKTGSDVKAFSDIDALSYDKARFVKKGSTLTSNISQIIRENNEYATEGISINKISGASGLDEKVYRMELLDTNGKEKVVEVTLRDVPDANGHLSTYKVIEPTESITYDIYDEFGNPSAGKDYKRYIEQPDENKIVRYTEDVNGVTYKQLFNVMSLAMTDNMPTDNSFENFNSAIAESEKHVDIGLDRKGRMFVKDLDNSDTKMQVSFFDKDTDRFDNYEKTVQKSWISNYQGLKSEQGWSVLETNTASKLTQVFGLGFDDLTLSGKDVNGADVTVSMSTTDTLQDLMDKIDDSFGDGVNNELIRVYMEDDKIVIKDNTTNNPTLIDINFTFNNAKIDMDIDHSPPITFSANNTITIDEGRIDLFNQLDDAIEAVKSQNYRADSNNGYVRNLGIENSIKMVDHLFDHIIRTQTENGAHSQTMSITLEKAEVTDLNIKTLKSSVLDTDMGEAITKLNQRTMSYQAMLSVVGKISQLSLVQYLR